MREPPESTEVARRVASFFQMRRIRSAAAESPGPTGLVPVVNKNGGSTPPAPGAAKPAVEKNPGIRLIYQKSLPFCAPLARRAREAMATGTLPAFRAAPVSPFTPSFPPDNTTVP